MQAREVLGDASGGRLSRVPSEKFYLGIPRQFMSNLPVSSDEAKVIAIAIVECHGHILIGQRPPEVSLAGLWEFPGGKVEPGESVAQAAVRETFEETGLNVQAEGTLQVTDFSYEHGNVRLNFVKAQLIGNGTELPPTRPPFRWVASSEIPAYEFPAGNSEILPIIAKLYASSSVRGKSG